MFGDIGRRIGWRARAAAPFMRVALTLAIIAFGGAAAAQRAADSTHSDAEIKKAIITASLSAYPGPCPCPYNTARNGSRCGKRSAYSRPGGYSPTCYEGDVTPAMVAAWRERHETRH